ncbi:hypothetical protein AcW1_003763 [Taiwanofungus camphoratus]|nr:hypothetical protein AcW1_003763 [Antrodia cinnamomea]
MPQATASASSSALKGVWRPTKIMNMRDLARDDDFLSHLLVEKLGTGAVPLVVHKMDPTRRLPKTDAGELLQIVRRLVAARGSPQSAIREAVDDLLSLNSVRYFLQSYAQRQINAFATHASRYFELYLPTGSIEIAHTCRYSHATGKSELCILATRPLMPGMVITELKGSMADLTEEEDKELKRTDALYADGVGIRRDFSVIHSKQLKKNHLFLGPARFVNHDCDHNVELFREGRYITFRVIKPIAVGEEVTAHYGDGYFGRKNRHCLCETCEKLKRGGYATATPTSSEAQSGSASGSGEDVHSDNGALPLSPSSDSDDSDSDEAIDVNQRSTRRGVYAVVKNRASKASGIGQMELDAEVEPDNASDLTSLPPSRSSVAAAGPSKGNGLMTPDPEPAAMRTWSRDREGTASVASSPRKNTPSTASTPVGFKSLISTRSQKAKEATLEPPESISAHLTNKLRKRTSARQLVTPPLTAESGSASAATSVRSSSRMRTRAADKERSTSRLPTPLNFSGASAAEEKRKDKAGDDREARTLRPRGFIPGVEQSSAVARKPRDEPRGLDGQPLPTCVTCKELIPIISVDSEIVWGDKLGRTGKRGRPRKHVNVECPRCMRHFAIYNLKWPERVPSEGGTAFVPTPREIRNSTPITHGTLAALNRKLAVAASDAATPKRQYNKRKRDVEDDGEQPGKRKKPTGRPRGRPPKNRVGMSSKAKEILNVKTASEKGRRSGRARMPSLKMRESEPPKPHSRVSLRSRPPESTASSSSALSGADSDDGVPTRDEEDGSPKLPTPKSLAVAAQPREANGRFGKKASTNGRYMRKNFTFTAGGRRSRAQRALHRSKIRSRLEKKKVGSETEDISSSDPSLDDDPGDHIVNVLRKRLNQEVEEGDDGEMQNVKRPRLIDGEEEGDDSHDEDASFRRPLSMRTKLSIGLLCAPNPLTFARRKWAPTPDDSPTRPEAADDRQSSTDDDADLPVTPEDNEDQPTVDIDQIGEQLEQAADNEGDGQPITSVSRSLLSAPSYIGKLTLRPSPVNLARRRWAPPPSKIQDKVDDNYAEEQPKMHRDNGQDDLGQKSLIRDIFSKRFDPASTKLNTVPRSLDHASSSDVLDTDTSFTEDSDALYPIESIEQSPPYRRASFASFNTIDSADDSEQVVERLVNEPHSGPSDHSDSSRPVSSRSILSSDRSPGLAWKQIVLLPTDIPYLNNPSASFSANFPSSPVKLVSAGWDTASDTDS